MKALALAALIASLAAGCAAIASLDEDFCQVDVDCPGGSMGGNAAAGGSSGSGGDTLGGTAGSTGGDTSGGGAAGEGNASGSGGAGGAGPPLPAGTLAFYRAVPGDDSQSEVILVDLPSGEVLAEVGAKLDLCNVRSPAFDATGHYLVVTAVQNPNPPDPCLAVTASQPEVFIVDIQQLGNKDSEVAVTSDGSAEAHPAFGRPISNTSGDYVYFEYGNHLVRWETKLISPQPFSTCNPPPLNATCFDGGTGTQTHPTTTGSPELLCYQEGASTGADIYCVELSEMAALSDPLQDYRFSPASTPSLAETHPEFFDSFLYFEKQTAQGSSKKSLVRVAVTDIRNNPNPEDSSFDTSNGASDSDVAVLAGDTVIFSRSTDTSGAKDLYVGVFGEPDVWSLDELVDTPINTDADEAGAAFFMDPL